MKLNKTQTRLPDAILMVAMSLGLVGAARISEAAQLTGSASIAELTYNLSAVGKTDWAHWGHGDNTPAFDHKLSGGNKISDVTPVGGGQGYGGNWAAIRSASWTDGTPTASSSANGGYYYTEELDAGWSFTVPADTAVRTLYVWCGGWGTHAKLTASLSDGSAADFSQEIWDTVRPADALEDYSYVYQITFQAASAGQTLTISYVKTQNDPRYNGGSADFKAAWLESGEPSVSITAPANDARYDVPTGNVLIEAEAAAVNGRTIAKVEFFDGATLLGTATTSPFSYGWNNASSGIHTLTAKATDSGGVSTVSAPVRILVYDTSLGGQAGGAVNEPSAAYNLSAVGATTLDWAHWGRGSVYPCFDHKSPGGNLISDVTVFGSGSIGGQQFPISASWTDGGPTASVTNDVGGYYLDSSASSDVGYSFTVPADSTVRTLYVLAGGNWSYAQLQAQLSDLSAEDYLPDVQGVAQGNYVTLYRITYKAASANQTLKVSYTKALTANGSVDLKAAWLVSGNPGDPPTRPVIYEPAANATYDAPASVTVSTGDPSDSDGQITRVEFYDGAALIGTDTSSPYSVTWNTSAKGPHLLTAKAVDNSGLYSVSAAIPIIIYGTGGEVNGSVAVADAGYNLTALGTTDWAHWGRGAQTDTFDHKQGANQISDVTWLPAQKYDWQTGGFGGSELDGRASSWTDGTPTLSASSDKGYYYEARQAGGGWSFTVPADTTQRTVFVYCGGYGTATRLTAHLSDWSLADYSVDTQAAANNQYQNLHRITYEASQAGQTLTVTYIKTGDPYGPGGSADLMAAWLVAAAPPTVYMTSPTDGYSIPSPATITLSADATDDGSVTKVEFFDGATKIGEGTTSPYSVTWNNAAIGTHIITARATDNDGAVGVSSAVTIIVTTTGGNLAGTTSAPEAGGYDLSAQNASDWVTWGRDGFYTNVDHKATGGSQISGLTEVVGSGFGATNESIFSTSWNDGAPTPSATADLGVIYCNAWILDVGWRFTVTGGHDRADALLVLWWQRRQCCHIEDSPVGRIGAGLYRHPGRRGSRLSDPVRHPL